MKIRKITLPFTDKIISELTPGNWLELTGTIYTARDQAHQRLFEALKKGEKLPAFKTTPVLYYAGPTPAKKGEVIGACGPTTSSRMDPFTPYLMSQGFKICIGKGQRNLAVKEAIKKYKGLYLSAFGGLGALYQEKIKKAKCFLYPDLLSEAIFELEVDSFPCVVEIVG